MHRRANRTSCLTKLFLSTYLRIWWHESDVHMRNWILIVIQNVPTVSNHNRNSSKMFRHLRQFDCMLFFSPTSFMVGGNLTLVSIIFNDFSCLLVCTVLTVCRILSILGSFGTWGGFGDCFECLFISRVVGWNIL